VLTLKDINRALDDLGVAAFVPRTQRRRPRVVIVVARPTPEPRDVVIDVVPEVESPAA